MSLYGSAAEYALHCLLHLTEPGEISPRSSADLADFQGISPSYVAKLFTKLERAGIVTSAEGVRGGYYLAKPMERITVLEVVDVVEGKKALFQCRDIRGNCVLYQDKQPDWLMRGTCTIHAVMLEGQARMREALAEHTVADIAARVGRIVPKSQIKKSQDWFLDRSETRTERRT